MNKNTKRYMIGAALSYVAMIMWCIGLDGFEYLEIMDVLDLIKQVALPFIFTELWVAIGVEGCRNLKQQFNEFVSKLKEKKVAKEMEAE